MLSKRHIQQQLDKISGCFVCEVHDGLEGQRFILAVCKGYHVTLPDQIRQ